MNLQLDEEVRSELNRRRGDWRLISDLSGVSHSWISQFCRNKIPNPGFATLKRLACVLFPQAVAAPDTSARSDQPEGAADDSTGDA